MALEMRFNNTVRDAIGDAIIAALDAGDPTPGYIKIYTGNKDGTRGVAPTGTLLGTLTLSLPSGTCADGVLTFDAVTEDDAADNNGTAGCCAFFDGDDVLVLDGNVTVAGAGGLIELNTTTIVAGGPIGVTSATLTIGQ